MIQYQQNKIDWEIPNQFYVSSICCNAIDRCGS